MDERSKEKKEYIIYKLKEIEKAFLCTNHRDEIKFKWYESICNKTIIVDIEILGIKKDLVYFSPEYNIKSMDKQFKEISRLILI